MHLAGRLSAVVLAGTARQSVQKHDVGSWCARMQRFVTGLSEPFTFHVAAESVKNVCKNITFGDPFDDDTKINVEKAYRFAS